MNRLLEKYKTEVAKGLAEKFAYKNVMQLPKLEKIVINMAVGDAVGNAKALESAMADLTTIAGQKPVVTRAKKSLAAWKQLPRWYGDRLQSHLAQSKKEVIKWKPPEKFK